MPNNFVEIRSQEHSKSEMIGAKAKKKKKKCESFDGRAHSHLNM